MTGAVIHGRMRVLVLSSFTGASRELSEALIVNPYHTHEMATLLGTALRIPEQEQRERMRLMRRQVREAMSIAGRDAC
jgi:trehalose 6-phosphate synthase